MAVKTLQDVIEQAGSPLKLLRDSGAGAGSGPLTVGQVSNWHTEQLSWRETAGLFDLSHHMTDLTVRGPDAVRLVSDLGVNSLATFAPGKAKHMVAVTEEGHVIGDAILDYIDTDNVRIVGTPAVPNWVQFHIETRGYDVTWSRDEPTAGNALGHPELYRFQVNGPRAFQVLENATGRPLPAINLLNAGTLTIGGRRVRALGHTMSRAEGLELTGPWTDAAQIREALLDAGQQFGLTPIGSRAPTFAGLESGWLPAPIPAVFAGDSTKSYREWLSAEGWEATGSLGGSMVSDDISDYYLNPRDLDYSRLVNFDHDFIGRDALANTSDGPSRRKVTLVWNTDDVLDVVASGFAQAASAKYMDFPLITHSTWQYDQLLSGHRPVGFSTIAGYTYNQRQILSLGVVDHDVELGAEVTVVWGDPDGDSDKPQAERHTQTPIRATVSRVPYSEVYDK